VSDLLVRLFNDAVCFRFVDAEGAVVWVSKLGADDLVLPETARVANVGTVSRLRPEFTLVLKLGAVERAPEGSTLVANAGTFPPLDWGAALERATWRSLTPPLRARAISDLARLPIPTAS